MNIILANPRGFCAGVDRAIEITNKALDIFGAPIYVKHEIVHNKYVVDELKEKVNKSIRCIIDRIEPDFLWCRTEYDAPEVDGIVKVKNSGRDFQAGDMLNVSITRSLTYDLEGKVS